MIIDTNVPIVANGRAEQAGLVCQLACVVELEITQAERRVLVDDFSLIIDEYRRHLSPSGQPGLGDAFFKWLWNNQGNTDHCLKVAVTRIEESEWDFEEYPDDSELANFDRSDRKFVAVCIASGGTAPILNASDRDWWEVREVLAAHGIEVRFLCSDLMTA